MKLVKRGHLVPGGDIEPKQRRLAFEGSSHRSDTLVRDAVHFQENGESACERPGSYDARIHSHDGRHVLCLVAQAFERQLCSSCTK